MGWLIIGAAGFIGFWPLHGLLPGGSAAFLGGVILLRLGARVLPEGMAHWAPLLAPAALVGLWHAAVSVGPDNRTRRWVAILMALAVIGLTGGGSAGAGWLLAASAAYPILAAVGTYLPALPLGASRLLWLPAVWGGLQALQAGLGQQAVYTALAAAGIAVAMIAVAAGDRAATG